MMKNIPYITVLLAFCCFLAPAQEQQQVNVSVKIIEFQTSKGSATGLSTYFKHRVEPRPYGIVSTGRGAITAASLAFPNVSTGGISLFLDRLSSYYGDFEVVLQALVDQNRAFILSQPKVMVAVGSEAPTIIKTTQDVSYENTVVVGATTTQTTAFRATGVTLTVNALKVVDDDGDPTTQDDVYILLKLIAEINEEGERITVALDDRTGTGGTLFSEASNAITVPEFITRSIDTTVWVRQDQVLILGGLYRNTKNKNVASLPWLTQGQNILNNVAEWVSPLSETPEIPLTSAIGSREDSESRRELVFLVKADLWRKAYTVTQGFEEYEESDEESTEGEGGDEIIRPRPGPGFFDGLMDTLTGDGQGVNNSLGRGD